MVEGKSSDLSPRVIGTLNVVNSRGMMSLEWVSAEIEWRCRELCGVELQNGKPTWCYVVIFICIDICALCGRLVFSGAHTKLLKWLWLIAKGQFSPKGYQKAGPFRSYTLETLCTFIKFYSFQRPFWFAGFQVKTSLSAKLSSQGKSRFQSFSLSGLYFRLLFAIDCWYHRETSRNLEILIDLWWNIFSWNFSSDYTPVPHYIFYFTMMLGSSSTMRVQPFAGAHTLNKSRPIFVNVHSIKARTSSRFIIRAQGRTMMN